MGREVFEPLVESRTKEMQKERFRLNGEPVGIDDFDGRLSWALEH
jgi:hypothetical protein